MAGAPFPNFPIGTVGPKGQDVSPFFQGYQLWQQQQLEALRRQQAAQQFAEQMSMRRMDSAEQSRMATLELEDRQTQRGEAAKRAELDRAEQADYRETQQRQRDDELGLRKTELDYRKEQDAAEAARRTELDAKAETEHEEVKSAKAAEADTKKRREASAYAVEEAIAQYAGDPSDAEGLAEHLRTVARDRAASDPAFDAGAFAAVANQRVAEARETARKQKNAEVDDELKRLQLQQAKDYQREEQVRKRVEQANKVVAAQLRVVEQSISKNENLLMLMGDPGEDAAKINRVNAIKAALVQQQEKQASLLRQAGENELKVRQQVGAAQPAAQPPMQPELEAARPQSSAQQGQPAQRKPSGAQQPKPQVESDYEEYLRLSDQLRGGMSVFLTREDYNRAAKRKAELEQRIRRS